MKNITSYLKYKAQAHPDRIAIATSQELISYDTLYKRSIKAASFLVDRGIAKGDCFAILEFNTPNSCYLILGGMMIGAVPTLINWRLIPKEIDFILTNSNSKVIYIGDKFQQIGEHLTIKCAVVQRDTLDKWLIHDLVEKVIWPEISEMETALLLYTSGTTGYPKGVPLSHKNLIWQSEIMANEIPGLDCQHKTLIVAPFFNIAGAGYFLLSIITGGQAILMPYFDSNQVIEHIKNFRVTNIFLAPVMIQGLILSDKISEADFSSLLTIHYGGSPMNSKLLDRAREIFKCNFMQGYGLTETSGIVSILRHDDHFIDEEKWERTISSAGRPIPFCKVKIIDLEEMEVPVGTWGEIVVKGENIFNGYLNSDSSRFDKYGWFKTEDIGYFDSDGFLYVVDRKNDMIVSKGINVYPAEVERILIDHPAIEDVAVIGIPSDEYGEAICACIVTKEEVTLLDLQNWCEGQLSQYKKPRHLKIVTELPKNLTGKTLRKELKKEFWDSKVRKVN